MKEVKLLSKIPNKYKKAISFILVAFSVIILSEIIYAENNRPLYLINYYLDKADKSIQRRETQNATNYLIKAANTEIKYISQQYPSLIARKPIQNIDLSNSSSNFKHSFISYLSTMGANTATPEKHIHLSKLFYSLGILAYKNQEHDFVAPFFQAAIYLVPTLSHYHVELANYYLFSGEEEKAKDKINYCLEFIYAIEHCEDYKENILIKNSPEQPGFLEKEIEIFFDSIKDSF